MKKYTLFLFAFVLFCILLGANFSSVNAQSSGGSIIYGYGGGASNTNVNSNTNVSGSTGNCSLGDLFSRTTGQRCSTTPIATACQAGDIFNSLTGQRCAVAANGGGTISSSGTPSRLLAIGSRGEDVKSVQQILKNEGYYTLRVDGNYGPGTARAVRNFQEDNYLSVTGSVDANTLAVLNSFGGGIISTTPSITNPLTSGLTITTASLLPNAKVGQSYSVTLQATGRSDASSPYLWNLVDGFYSSGLILNGQGVLSGTPQNTGTYTFSVQLNSGTQIPPARKTFTLTVDSATTTQPSITVISPNGGENYVIGSSYDIQWSALNFPSNSTVYIELRPNNFNVGSVSKIAAVSSTSGHYLWKVPNTITSGQYIIELYDGDQNGNINPNGSAKDVSNSYFTITAPTTAITTQPSVTVTSPNIGGTWVTGATLPVRWRINGVAYPYTSVYLQPENSNTVYALNPNFSSSGINSFDWVVNLASLGISNTTGRYRILVQNHSGTEGSADARDYGDSYFTITAPATVQTSQPSITVISPNGGETFEVGKNITVSWRTTGISSTTNLGAIVLQNWTGEYDLTDNRGVLNDGTHTMKIPVSVPAGSYVIVIKTDVGSTLVLDKSDSYFTITAPTTTVTAPTVDLKIDGLNGPVSIESGKFITPDFTSTNASSCVTNWNTDRSTFNHGITVGPLYATGTYSVTCYNTAGSASDSVTVNVAQPAAASAVVPVTPTVIVSISTVAPTPSQNITMSGNISGTGYAGQNCWAFNTNGGSTPTSGCWSPNGIHPSSGVGTKSVSWTAGVVDNVNYTFFLCTNGVSGPCGRAGTLKIKAVTTVATPAPTIDLKIDGSNGPLSIQSGKFITPDFTSTNASSCVTNWNTDRSTFNHGITVGPVNTTGTYSVTCTNTAGVSASDSVTVNVSSVTATINISPSFNANISGPTTLAKDTDGGWVVSASDPDGTQLTYSVNWGDNNNVLITQEREATTVGGTSQGYLNHSYTSTGTYNIVFTATDVGGLSATKTTSVTVY